MSSVDVDNVVSFASEPTLVDHLIAAYRVVSDPTSKAMIEAALIREGHVLAATVPLESFTDDAGQHA